MTKQELIDRICAAALTSSSYLEKLVEKYVDSLNAEELAHEIEIMRDGEES